MAPGAAPRWSQPNSCRKYKRELRFERNELVDELLGAAMEPHFPTGRLEVAVGPGKKPVPYIRTGDGAGACRLSPWWRNPGA